MSTFNEILEKIQRWDLNAARVQLDAVREQLTNEERDRSLDVLIQYTAIDAQIQVVAESLERAPQSALAELRGMSPEGQKHPKYKHLLETAQRNATKARKERAVKLIEEAEQAVNPEARQWATADAKVELLEKIYPEWVGDDSLRKRVLDAQTKLGLGRAADRKLSELNGWLDVGNWQEADAAIAALEIEYREYITDTQLEAAKIRAEKVRTHASGLSTQRRFEDEIANVEAALRSVEQAEDWRAAYNNANKLYLLQSQRGITVTDEQNKRLDDYLEQLRVSVREKIDQRIEDARKALQGGDIEKARSSIQAARDAGKAPLPKPGEPLDVAETINPTGQQDTALAQLEGEASTLEERRREAKAHWERALQLTSNETLKALREAGSALRLVQDIDPHYPGLQVLLEEVDAGLQRLSVAEYRTSKYELTTALRRGDIESAKRALDAIRAPELADLEIVKSELAGLEEETQATEQRERRVSAARAHFEALFESAKDRLDCTQEMVLREALEAWKEDAFDLGGSTSALAQVDQFFKECQELSQSRDDILSGIESVGTIDHLEPAAARLEWSGLGKRPAVVRVLARFWKEMARRHGTTGNDLRYLRRAQALADMTDDQVLKAEVDEEVRRVQEQSEKGKSLATVESGLRGLINSGDWDAALAMVAHLDVEQKQDSAIAPLVARITSEHAKRAAKALLDQAREEDDVQLALDFVHQALDAAGPLPEALILQTSLVAKQEWEAIRARSMDEALEIDDMTSPASMTASNKQRLLGGLAVAEEVNEQTGRITVSKVLHTKAEQVFDLHDQWVEAAKRLLNDLEQEYKLKTEGLELDNFDGTFDALDRRLGDADPGGLPGAQAKRLVTLRQNSNGLRTLMGTINERWKKAWAIAHGERRETRTGEKTSVRIEAADFAKATRKLLLPESGSVPNHVREQFQATANDWNDREAGRYAELINGLPELRGTLASLVDPLGHQGGSDEGAGSSARLGLWSDFRQKIADKWLQIDDLQLTEGEPIQHAYGCMKAIAEWSAKADKADDSLDEDGLAAGQMSVAQLQAEGGKDCISAPPERLTEVVTAIDNRKRWMGKRGSNIRQLREFEDAIKSAPKVLAPGAGRVRLVEKRRAVEKAEDYTRRESEVRSSLLQMANETLNSQLRYSSTLMVLMLLVGLATFWLFTLISGAKETKAQLEATSTPYIVVVTPTSLPTSMPSTLPTTTPTITPTPTNTPVPPQPGVITVPGNANLRARPVVTDRSIGLASAGDRISLTGFTNAPDGSRWYRIDLPAKRLQGVWILARVNVGQKVWNSVTLDGGAAVDERLKVAYEDAIR